MRSYRLAVSSSQPWIGLRLEWAVGLVLGAIGCLIASNVTRAHLNPAAVSDHAVRAADGHIYRLLRYPGRNSIVVLDSESRYLGTMDFHHRVLDAVTLPNGTNAAPLLRSLPPF